jgi:hypothetical protein
MGKIRDQSVAYTLLGYIVLGVIIIVVFAIVAATVYWSAFHVSDASLANWGKWAGLAAGTALLFGYVMKQRRRLWRNNLFWRTLAGLLFVHIAGFFGNSAKRRALENGVVPLDIPGRVRPHRDRLNLHVGSIWESVSGRRHASTLVPPPLNADCISTS